MPHAQAGVGANREGASGRIVALAALLIALVVGTIGLTAKDAPGLSFIGAEAYAPVEPPPAEYDGRPFDVPGVTERHFDSKAELHGFCMDRLNAVLAAGHTFRACYIEADGLIALPSRWAVESRKERAELRAHEWAHARGWRHKAPPLTRERMAAIREQLGLR